MIISLKEWTLAMQNSEILILSEKIRHHTISGSVFLGLGFVNLILLITAVFFIELPYKRAIILLTLPINFVCLYYSNINYEKAREYRDARRNLLFKQGLLTP